MTLTATSAARRAVILAAITPDGTTLNQLEPVSPFKHRTNLVSIMIALQLAGEVWRCRAKIDTPRAVAYYFRTEADLDRFMAAYKRLSAERTAELQRDRHKRVAAARKAQRAAGVEQARIERAKKAIKTTQEAKTPKVNVRVAKRPKNASKRVLRDEAVYVREHRVIPVQKVAEPYIEPVITAKTRITVCPTPPSRWNAQLPEAGGFSHLKPGQYAFEPASCAARSA